MSFVGFEGPAGTGKTHELIETVRRRVTMPDIEAGQRVLALTFMHGSRRRLDERLQQFAETRGRFLCTTIDSFAGHLLTRWKGLAGELPNMNDFDRVCDSCGSLLERPEVARWVAASFPIIALDEAQELKPCRLRIVKALEIPAKLFVAADEFQCLDEGTDTGPFISWFETGVINRLVEVRRTGKRGLLDAGIALRNGLPPVSGQGLNLKYEYPNQMRFSIGRALNNARGSTAILVAPGSKTWAEALIPNLVRGFRTERQVVNPVRVQWEHGSSDDATTVADEICEEPRICAATLLERLRERQDSFPWLPAAISAVEHARRAHGRLGWTTQEIHDLLERKASIHKAYGYSGFRGVPIMSIHAAKNRQFRNVIVLWGPGVRGSDDLQRRLLYNAISRAEYQCSVFVRTQATLNAPPFA